MLNLRPRNILAPVPPRKLEMVSLERRMSEDHVDVQEVLILTFFFEPLKMRKTENIYIFMPRNYLQGSTKGRNIDFIKKYFKQKLLKIKFSIKKSSREHICSSHGG